MTATGTSIARPPRASAAREFMAAVGTIMVKELRSRMRGRRAFIVLTVYLGILALITYGVYVDRRPERARWLRRLRLARRTHRRSSASRSSRRSRSSSSILVAFIAPAFTAGQISLEREKQTLDLLISTPMRPAAIVVGKLAAALAFVVLMIVAAVPITAIVLMYGGASIDDIVRQQVVLLATALLLGAIGLFFSALLKRTQAATVLTYITMLALTLGTAMLFIFWTDRRQPDPGRLRVRAAEARPGADPVPESRDRHARRGRQHRARRRSAASTACSRRCEAAATSVATWSASATECRAVDQFGNVGRWRRAGRTGYWWPRVDPHLRRASRLALTLAADAAGGPGRDAVGLPPAGTAAGRQHRRPVDGEGQTTELPAETER